MKTFALLSIAALLATASATVNDVYLTTSYCPSVFSGKGAEVKVDVDTGNFTIVSQDWKWPQELGCPEDVDPTVMHHHPHIYEDFGTDWGLIVELDVATGKILKEIKPHTKETLFDGFTNFDEGNNGTLLGLTPEATQSGFCSDGCFQYGIEDTDSGLFVGDQYVPFKAVMTDVSFYEPETNLYWIQGSYPLDPTAACTADQTKQCLVALNGTTGAIVSSTRANADEVYMWADRKSQDGTLLAWVAGFESQCKNDDDSPYAFSRVNLATATFEFLSCIPKHVVVDTDPNIAAFSPEDLLFATGSGNSETGEVEVLVLDVTTGKTVLDSSLPGLKKALHVSTEAPFINIWGVSWA